MAKILIVDHMKDDVAAIKATLELQGHEVLVADNGADCVTFASFKSPDLILMDESVPGINGYQATRQLQRRAKTSHIPVVIMSNKNQQTEKLWSEEQGAVDFLVKPFGSQDLLNCVTEALEGRFEAASY